MLDGSSAATGEDEVGFEVEALSSYVATWCEVFSPKLTCPRMVRTKEAQQIDTDVAHNGCLRGV